MFGLGDIISVATGLGGVIMGNKQAAAARESILEGIRAKRIRAAQQQAMLQQNNRQLYSNEAGFYDQAIRNFAQETGARAAAGGVYNSSATAGATAKATGDASRALAELGLRLKNQELQFSNQNQNAADAQESDFRMNDLQLGQQQANAGFGGLFSVLGSVVQNNLGRSGAAKNTQNGNKQTTKTPYDRYINESIMGMKGRGLNYSPSFKF